MTRVKTCGITSLADAHRSVEIGAWAVGLIFWPGSPRACDPGEAELIGAELQRQAEVVGVFLNAPLDEVAAAADRCRLTMLQLHGDEGPSYCREAARRTGSRVIKAARISDAAQIRALRPFHTHLHLLDARSERAPGGTGQSFDWSLTALHNRRPPFLLSGGLNAGNVGEAIAATRPYGVDTASGTESAPGVKDPERLEAFFRAVATADEHQGAPA
ncbi:MAG: phosphoribosylanthranilate isomerase [Thermoleophilaceae bacterium]|nr:phosphoribosylanthranilate isomerase [Thermoleophilaceae bacterium]